MGETGKVLFRPAVSMSWNTEHVYVQSVLTLESRKQQKPIPRAHTGTTPVLREWVSIVSVSSLCPLCVCTVCVAS